MHGSWGNLLPSFNELRMPPEIVMVVELPITRSKPSPASFFYGIAARLAWKRHHARTLCATPDPKCYGEETAQENSRKNLNLIALLRQGGKEGGTEDGVHLKRCTHRSGPNPRDSAN